MKVPHSSDTESYSAFRTRLVLESLLPTFIGPPLLSATLLQLAAYCNVYVPGSLTKALLCFLSLPLCFTVRVQYTDWQQQREAKKLGARLIPRIRGKWPGNVDVLLRIMKSGKTHYVMDWAREMMEEAGSTTINTRMLWGNQYLTMDENVVKFMLATGFDHFDKGVEQKERMEDVMGNGIFNRDGEIWKAHRALTRPFFARERLIDFEIFEKYSQKTLDVLSNHPKGVPIDIQDLFARFTMDTGMTFLFNTNLDTLSLPLPKAYESTMGPKGSACEGAFGSFTTAFEEVQQVLSTRVRRRMVWKYFEFFRNASDAPMKIVKEYIDPLVRKALEERDKYQTLSKEEQAETSDSFLRFLAMSTEDVATIRHELITMLGASRDTTAILLTSAIYAFTQHPEVLARLREEILEVCPKGHIPTYEDIRRLKYLRAVLNETLRVFPAVPANTRSVRNQPVAVPVPANKKDSRPLYMSAKAAVAYFPILILKRKDLWGPDAYQYDPNRWMDDGSGRMERVVKNPFMFLPFHAGPRICLGQQFALNEASFFLVRLLQHYDSFELALDAQPEGSLPPAEWAHSVKEGRSSVEKVWYQNSVTMYIRGGLWIKPHREV